MNEALLSVKDAQERVLASVRRLQVESLPLAICHGRVLAQDVHAETDLPPFDNSAMDGYAVRASDLAQASEGQPVRLRVIGDVAAGQAELPTLEAGGAVRIMTGGVLPPGADAVVPVEWTHDSRAMIDQALPESIQIERSVEAQAYVRKAGQDVRREQLVLSSGHQLRAADIGMLASLGRTQVRVYRRAKVAVLSTGDELLEPDQPLTPGKIRDSNSYALAAALESAGAEVLRLGIVRDSRSEVIHRLDEAVAEGVNLIVTSAGVSMGAYDVVRSAIESGGSLGFWRVNLRPGKPLVLGHYRETPVLGLPGNPVSALITFELFVRPAVDRLHGLESTPRIPLPVRLEQSLHSDGRESYLRAQVWFQDDAYHARLTGSQDSGVLSSMILANALLVLPAGVMKVEAGEVLTAWLLAPLDGAADLN